MEDPTRPDNSQIPSMKRIVENAILEEKSSAVIDKFLKQREEMPKLVTEIYEEDKIGIEKQLESSDQKIAELVANGNELITNIRLANDRREVERRVKEAELRDVLLEDLQKESMVSSAKFEEISSKWNTLEMQGVQDPMAINDHLNQQKNRISELMHQKMTIINECRNELNAADFRYVQDMEKQENDVICLVQRIDKQMEVVKRTFREHLDLLETTIDEERQIFKAVTTKKWDSMYEKRAVNEEMKIKREKEKNEFYSNEINRIQLQHEELIRATKIRLELDNQALEIEVQKLKRNIMLNSEKLDYNFQVLKKREDENLMIRNQQKRRLTKLAETIVSLKRKLKEAKTTCVTETKRHTSDIMVLHGKIIEIQKKSDLFAEQNNRKYLAVWDINYDECTKTLDHILKIDKMLWQQQLGLEWEAPLAHKPPKKEQMPSFEKAMALIYGSSFDNSNKKPEPARNSTVVLPKKFAEGQKTSEDHIIEQKLLKTIFRAIADNSGFLIEGKLKVLLKPYADTERTLVNLDAVFNALGIFRSDEIDYIKQYFVKYIMCKKCNKNPCPDSMNYDEARKSSPDEESSECLQLVVYTGCAENDHEFEITPMNVFKALCQFTKEHTTSLDQPVENLKARSNKSHETITRLIDTEDVEKCFANFKDHFPIEREKVWNVFEDGLQHYLKVLKEREALEADCAFLRKQNMELNHLMSKFVPNSL